MDGRCLDALRVMLLPQFSGVTSFYLDYFDFFDDSDFNKSRINFLSGLVNVRNIFENFAASVSTLGLRAL